MTFLPSFPYSPAAEWGVAFGRASVSPPKPVGEPMDKAYFSDKLRRTLEMEETMNALLSGLLQSGSLPDVISPEDRERFLKIIKAIHEDSKRHEKINREMLAELT